MTFLASYILWNLKTLQRTTLKVKDILFLLNVKLNILIQADSEGPTAEQRQFYTHLQNNFEQYIQKMKPLIEDEFSNWKEDFEIKDFDKEFTLVCVTIPRSDTKPLIWDMAFTTIHDENHDVTIDFIDHEPNGLLIDG